MKIAGIMQVKDYSDSCGAFQQLRDLCDVVIVLDNNSSAAFPFKHDCDDYITLNSKYGWNCTANLTHLMYQAFARDCEYALHLDDDMVIGSELAKKLRFVTQPKMGAALWVERRDLWENKFQYRTDGVWSNKWFPAVIRNWFYDSPRHLLQPVGRNRFHKDTAPLHLPRAHAKEFCVYHAGCMTHSDRLARVNNYIEIGSDIVTGKNYEYMLDNRGIMTAGVPQEDLALILKYTNTEIRLK